MNTSGPAPGARERELFIKALEQPDVDARAAFLDEACGADAALRARLELLLRQFESVGTFMAEPAAGRGWQAPPSPGAAEPSGNTALTEQPGQQIGRYKLLEKLGDGGFGVVYMAEQREPVKRRVALKIIKAGMDVKEVIARFEAERQALALMDHPNIAKVLDGGATDTGRPYFVMELVRGVRITDFCDQNQLGLKERLELFMQVCHAVQHAHQKGIIHRDLKPSNILVTINDNVPVPKVIDFGIAKATQQQLTEKTLFTAYGQFMGTPAYMSPEQTVMTSLDIDTRSDVYSLGVLLYELLAGKPPFDTQQLLKVALDELCRTLREVEPPRPSTRLSTMAGEALASIAKFRKIDAPKLVHYVRGDLDWIVMKCLEKDRARRYETANGLAADLQRHLSNEPVVARPPTTAYRLQKLIRRNKLAFAAASSVVLALLGGAMVSTWQAVRATRAEREQTRLRGRAETENARSKEALGFLREMLIGARPATARDRDTGMLRIALDKAARRLAEGQNDRPEVRSEIRQILGNTYFEIGAYDQAEKILREEVEWLRRTRSPEDRRLGDCCVDLGRALHKLNRMSEAEPFLREALAIHRKTSGSNSVMTAWMMMRLAEFLEDRRQTAEADATFRDAFAITERGITDTNRAARILHSSLLYDLSVVLEKRGHLTQAVALAEQALSIDRELAGKTGRSPKVAADLDRLGDLAGRAGDYSRAEPLLTESADIFREQFGDNNWDRARPLTSLGQVYAERGDRAKAEAAWREALALFQKFSLASEKEQITTLHNLSIHLDNDGRYSEALPFAEQALELNRKVYGEESREAAEEMLQVGGLNKRLKDYAKAEPILLQSVARHRKLLGNTNVETARALYTLAGVYVGSKGALPQTNALPLLRETLSILRQHPGADQRVQRFALSDLAILRREAGDYTESDAVYAEALALDRQIHGTNSAKVALVLNWLAVNAWQQKDYPRSHRFLREGLAIVRERLGETNADASEAFEALTGLAFHLAGKLPEADGVALSREVIALERERLAGKSADLASLLKDWAERFAKIGMTEEAEKMFREYLALLRQHLPPEHDQVAGNTASFARTLAEWAWQDRAGTKRALAAARARDAEKLLRECLEVRLNTLAPAHSNYWRIADTQSRLGFAVAAVAVTDAGLDAAARLTKFADAERLLVEGQAALQTKRLAPPVYQRDAMRRLEQFYAAWNELAPDAGRAQKAAEWKQKLNELDRSTATGPQEGKDAKPEGNQ